MIDKLMSFAAITLLSANAWSAELQDNGDGSVTDLESGRTWQQDDDNTRRDWKSAQAYCDDLILAEKADWRLPTPEELASIVVYKDTHPTIDTAKFPSTQSSGYWSGTIMQGNSWQAWYVDFYYGPVDFSSKKQSHYVRCIR